MPWLYDVFRIRILILSESVISSSGIGGNDNVVLVKALLTAGLLDAE
jgi:hypothetical protein